jgi:hypothetical protein
VHKKVCTIIANILPLIRNDVKVLRVNKLARTARYAAGELGYGFLDKTGPEFRKQERYAADRPQCFLEVLIWAQIKCEGRSAKSALQHNFRLLKS